MLINMVCVADRLKHFAHPLSTSFCRVFLNPFFKKIQYFKPPSSRNDSSEGYWVCLGWRGVPDYVTMEHLERKMQSDVEAEIARGSQREEEQRAKQVETEVAAMRAVDSSTSLVANDESPRASGLASVSGKDSSTLDSNHNADSLALSGSAEESLPVLGEVIDWRPMPRQL
jgi:hypothetical protein